MSTAQSWIGDVLHIFHRREVAEVESHFDRSRFDRFRLMFEHSRLLDRANATCDAINIQSGEGLIYQEIFMDSHPVVGRYILEKENMDITMELAILYEGPGVVFSCKKVRPWVKKIQRYCGFYMEEKSHVVCKMLINPASITDGEVQMWFTYLLSGLHHSLKPTRRAPPSTGYGMAEVFPARRI
jgi:hypothetical protein